MAQPHQQSQQSRPAQQQPRNSLAIASADPKTLNAHLAAISEHVNLVSPATVVGHLPEGFEVVMSAITVDLRTAEIDGKRKYVSKEVYELPAGGGLGLAKVVLDRLAAAAGVEWDPAQSGRVDDGRDPNFVHYVAVGKVTEFDGTTRTITAEKILDVREGSPAIDAIRARRKGDSAENQIRELRLFALEHAESKAKNRALRGGLGVKTSYTLDELRKPFVVPRLMLTGHSEDPARRREIANRIIDAKLGSARSLYPAEQPRLVQHTSRPTHATPPVGSVPLDEDDVPPARPTPKAPAAPAPAQPRKAAPAAQPSGGNGSSNRKSGVVAPYGRGKGKDLADLDDDDLEWLAKALSENVDDPEKQRYRADNERKLAAANAELDFRAGKGGEPQGEAPPADDDPTGGYGERKDL